jgi:hypothetical protein
VKLTSARSPLAHQGGELAQLGEDLALVGEHLAQVGGQFALVGGQFAQVGEDLALMGEEFALAGEDLAQFTSSFALVGELHTQVGESRFEVGPERFHPVSSPCHPGSLKGRGKPLAALKAARMVVLLNPGHRPAASALGYALPARWAGNPASVSRRSWRHDRPARSKRSPAPLVHALSLQVRRDLRTAYSWFVAAFRTAAEKLQAGDRAAPFPAGSFPPALPVVSG